MIYECDGLRWNCGLRVSEKIKSFDNSPFSSVFKKILYRYKISGKILQAKVVRREISFKIAYKYVNLGWHFRLYKLKVNVKNSDDFEASFWIGIKFETERFRVKSICHGIIYKWHMNTLIWAQYSGYRFSSECKNSQYVADFNLTPYFTSGIWIPHSF